MIETEAAWLAGYIDGDGCISLMSQGKSGKRTKRLIVTIDSADPELLDEVMRIAGGFVVKKTKYVDNHRQTYSWRLLGSDKIITLLEYVVPYMRCEFKKYRAIMVLQQWRKCTPRNGKYSEDQLKQKLLFEEQFFNCGTGRGRRIYLEGLGTSEPKSL